MKFIFCLLFFNLIISIYSKIFWLPEEIKNPLINPHFCNIESSRKNLICDPENLILPTIKKDLMTDLTIYIPQSTPCFCDKDCNFHDYRKRLMIAIVAISSIDRSMTNCSMYTSKYECFSARVLQQWNISLCDGNNGLILLTENKIHLYFGVAVRRRISTMCIHKLNSSIRPYIPLIFNLRTIFKETTRVLKKPCICNDSCSFRHLKWLTNIVFFMGVIVLVTCIGGMSRRAMLAKFHQRSFSSRHIINDFSIRRPPSSFRVTRDHSVDNIAIDMSDDVRPPDYSTLCPLPKPPPYSTPSTIQPVNTKVSEDDNPPSYELFVGNDPSIPTASVVLDPRETRSLSNGISTIHR